MGKYEELRSRYPRFVYKSYEVQENDQELQVTYHFEIEGLASFAPRWTFPKSGNPGNDQEDSLMQDMLFSLGMVELVSYWKITCSPTVVVQAGTLSLDQAAWWKNLYYNGLGEFFYVNGISQADPESFMELSSQEPGKDEPETEKKGSDQNLPPLSQGVLVPIGGGKDSAVSLELLTQHGIPVSGYIINPRGATLHTAEKAGLEGNRLMKAGRTLDPRMLELNRQGFLNGHTPFSALVAFSSLIAARLMGLPYIALSNESSANESTVRGSTVNHQYSKSFQFEQDFHRYAERYLPGSAYYFSLLRPLSEFQIARYFAAQKKYHSIFRSCNAGSKTDSWCAHCPKCLFVYLILSPFLEPEEVEGIFGRNMLEDETMKETLCQLVGIREEKPFECVGSRDEVNTAIVMTIDQMERRGKALPALLAYYRTTDLYPIYQAAGNRYASYFDEENLLPLQLEQLVKEQCVWTE